MSEARLPNETTEGRGGNSSEVLDGTEPSAMEDLLYGNQAPQEAAQEDAPEAEAQENIEGEDRVEHDDAPGDQEPDVTETTVETLSEFLEATEVDPEFFDGVKVKVRVNEQDSEVTFKDLVGSYQMQQSAEQYLNGAKAEYEKAKRHRSEESQTAALQLGVAQKLMGWIAQEIEGQSKEDEKELAELRERDPGEYAARLAEVNERKERLEKAQADAAAELQQDLQKRQQSEAQDLKQIQDQQYQMLLENIPEWRDSEEKAQKDLADVAKYLVATGYSPEDVMITAASDHRHILVARKAMLWDQLQSNSNVSRKKVVPKPKSLKPGNGAAKPKERPKDFVEALYG